MILRSPLFRRLFLPSLGLLLAAIAAVGGFAAYRLRASYLEDRRQALRDEAILIESLLAGIPDAEAGGRLRALAGAIGCRVTVVSADGRVTADTMGDPARMDNHGDRPEIREAGRSGEGMSVRRSDTVGQSMMYLARRTTARDGGNRFVRLAVPLSALDAHLDALTSGVALFAAVAALAAGAFSFVLARRHAAPVLELTRTADALARGMLGKRAQVRETGEIGALAASLNAMADVLARMIGQAGKDRDELRALLAAMKEGVVATDRDQRILTTNAAAADLLDFRVDDPRGRPLWEVVRDEAVLKAAADVLGGGGARAFPIGPVRGRHVEIGVGPVPSAGTPEGLVLVARDTTESVRYQELRKEFVANVSHELRTPLTFIRGFVETLQDGALRDPVKGPEFLATIQKHVIQLTNLVEDLLELSRLESRPGLPSRVRVDLAETARRVADLRAPAAQAKRQTLEVAAPAGAAVVAGDPDYLERAVANLVDNAIKYTPEGGAVRVTARRDGGAVAVEVEDTGIGIPAEDLPRIFERFYRVDKSRSRDMGGTGLGLSIVKHIAQVHGGTVDVQSQPGKGSVFRLSVPFESS